MQIVSFLGWVGVGFRVVFNEIKKMGEAKIVLDCSLESIPVILKQAQQVGLVTSSYSFFFTSLVGTKFI